MAKRNECEEENRRLLELVKSQEQAYEALWKEYGRLQQANERLGEDNSRLVFMLAESRSTAAQLGAELAELKEPLRGLPTVLKKVERHEEDIRFLLGRYNESRTDLSSAVHRHYDQIAEEFEWYYAQKARGLLNQVRTQLPKDDRDGRRPQAEFLASLLRKMFTEDHPTAEGIIDWLTEQGIAPPADIAADVARGAARIRTAAVNGGSEHRWRFDAACVNPDDETYTGCKESDPVAFVVKPAFEVADEILIRPVAFRSQDSPPTQ